MSNKITIINIVGGPMSYGGTESFIMNHFRLIDKERFKYKFIVFTDSIGVYDEEIIDNGGVIYRISDRQSSSLLNHLIKFFEVCKSQKILNPIFHLHLDGLNGFYAIVLRLLGFKKVVVHSHNTNFQTELTHKLLYHKLFRYLSRGFATHFAACGYDAGRWLFGKQIADNNTVFFPNAIDFNKFKFSDLYRFQLREKYQLNDYYIIGHIGRFHKQKNHEFIVDIAKWLKPLGVKFKFFLVGEGEEEETIFNRILENDLTEFFEVVSPNHEIYKYYSLFDLFILPSLFEGLPLVLVESQVNGLKSVVSDKVSIEAKMNDDLVFLSLDDIEAWIKQIRYFYLNNNVRGKANNYSEELKNFDINHSVLKLESFYEGIDT
jgi:glycosyltransferase EpsF